MLFKEGTSLYAYEIIKETGSQVAYVNYMGAPFVPNLADNPDVMSRTFDILIQSPNLSRIVFVQQRNYNYGPEETFMLQEIANVYVFLTKQEKVLTPTKLSIMNTAYVSQRYNDMSYLLVTLRQDPVACYMELKRYLNDEKVNLENTPENYHLDQVNYIRLLERFMSLLEGTKLFKLAQRHLPNYIFGTREIYHHIFKVDIMPNFSVTRLHAGFPDDAEIVDQYKVGKGDEISMVTILKRPQDSKYIYHLMPPEYSLSEKKQKLINDARAVMMQHSPKSSDFTDPSKVRQVFFNFARDLLNQLATDQDIKVSYDELNMLTSVVVRHTNGFGLIEVLLQDDHLQDVVLNAPVSSNPIFLRHSEYEECITNIIPSIEDAESWATRFRMISGQALDEAHPIFDYNLDLENKISARVAIIQNPLSPNGLAYAFRRHRENPWTLPLFIKNKMVNSFSAGLLSFLIDGSRTLLIAGTRSSGKTSLLGSLMLEIMSKYRVIVVEDTLELPVEALRRLKYDILRMKVSSSLSSSGGDDITSADKGIRTSLRLGDSSLIVGEIRSVEAKALYEAMRVGALANVVAGTIHGASAYGVFDRVVNDLNVPATSFKATDVVIIANPVKSPGGMRTKKRMIQLTEVRKHWTHDPEIEGGFVDLLKYNVETDELEPTEELINGDSEIIKSIAANVKGWAGDWDAVYDNILLRGKVKQEVVNISEQLKMPEILEAKFNSISNNMFQHYSAEVAKEIGIPKSERVFPLWQKWLIESAKARKFI